MLELNYPEDQWCYIALSSASNHKAASCMIQLYNSQAVFGVISQSALEVGPSHCPNGLLGQDLGFGRFAFALKLPEWLSTNLVTVRAKLGQTSSFPNGPRIWLPIGQ